MRVSYPFKGIDKGRAAHQQTPDTTSDIKNMRLFDTLDDRARGGQRPALDKWGAGTQIGAATQPVVAIITVSSVV